jgi:hypothetical protein
MGYSRIYTRLMKEIRSAVDGNLVSSDAPITYQQSKKLPYLQVSWLLKNDSND